MYSDYYESTLSKGEIQVMLDGLPIGIPAGRRSLAAIRSYLETLAMEHQRILCTFNVDSAPANASQLGGTFYRIEAATVDLDNMPLQVLQTALLQTAEARARVESAITVVLINEGNAAREFWWDLAQVLKLPLVTLSLLPESMCGSSSGVASPGKLRKWQFQQLAALIKDVDEACWCEDAGVLSNALENRVLPWLQTLHELILLWRETAEAGTRLKYQHA
ncbi:MAG TPA: hypothetical protein VH255_00305 [Verrucomicrobiae bacterium]|nr:hypothetical protein [Verrucomicrobiae bacterium]